MKTIVTLVALIAGVFGIAVLPARADLMAGSGDPFKFFFDENGNGSYTTDGTTFHSATGVLAADPTNAANKVLIYTLPSSVVSGDVRIWEDAAKTVLSDDLRFTNATGDLSGGLNANLMIYYSDAGDADLADTSGIPATLTPRDAGGIVEVGPEGSNGFDFKPGAAFPAENEYVGTSDAAVPEPAPMVLLATVIGGLALACRRRLV